MLGKLSMLPLALLRWLGVVIVKRIPGVRGVLGEAEIGEVAIDIDDFVAHGELRRLRCNPLRHYPQLSLLFCSIFSFRLFTPAGLRQYRSQYCHHQKHEYGDSCS